MKFTTDYLKHDDRLYRHIAPQPLDNPKLGLLNHALIKKLGLGALNDSEWTDVISGRLEPLAKLAPHGLQPIAMAYAGHQFGQWAGQLGDGRGLLIAQLQDDDGKLTDLHLKGAGRTPYSRHGDGRAMIASTVRELLGSHALNHLGVPSSDAIGFVVSDTQIRREYFERSAALLRVSDCHVRLGHFEWVAMYAPDYFTDFVHKIAQSYYPTLCNNGTTDVTALLSAIARNTAQMIARWQLVGFSHGVMNTDNLNITGTTLDFGPYGFMEGFHPAWINNHSDHTGRYTYQNQPMIGHWNLATVFRKFGQLVSQSEIDNALDDYENTLTDSYYRGLLGKLGFVIPDDKPLDDTDDRLHLAFEFLEILQQHKLDYTNGFRALIAVVNGDQNLENTDKNHAHEYKLLSQFTLSLPHAHHHQWHEWRQRYFSCLAKNAQSKADTIAQLQHANPVYILRNHMAQKAIDLALMDDFSEVKRLFELLKNPYQSNPISTANDTRMALSDEQVAVSCMS